LDRVKLVKAVSDRGRALGPGLQGTVVLCHGAEAYEVEFDGIDDFFQISAKDLEKSNNGICSSGAEGGQLFVDQPEKSGFFLSFGYSVESWTRLRDDLLAVANNFPHNFWAKYASR